MIPLMQVLTDVARDPDEIKTTQEEVEFFRTMIPRQSNAFQLMKIVDNLYCNSPHMQQHHEKLRNVGNLLAVLSGISSGPTEIVQSYAAKDKFVVLVDLMKSSLKGGGQDLNSDEVAISTLLADPEIKIELNKRFLLQQVLRRYRNWSFEKRAQKNFALPLPPLF
jgi:hypothetical protein